MSGSGLSAERRVVGVACAVDGLKGQVEVKLLLGCSPSEIGSIQVFVSAAVAVRNAASGSQNLRFCKGSLSLLPCLSSPWQKPPRA